MIDRRLLLASSGFCIYALLVEARATIGGDGRLAPRRERYVIQPVDPLSGAALADGTIRAPLLSFAESSRRYTAAM